MRIVVTGSAEPVAIRFVISKGHTVSRRRGCQCGCSIPGETFHFSRGYYTVVGHLPGGDQSTRVPLQ